MASKNLDRKAKIQVLSDHTINQIAAGEVIENPASVVKELVENAVDAGALRIVIELMGGGFHLIRISDDGEGMGPEDVLLALQRHATSKMVEAEELFSLSTMGFRGEALASIAAIAKMSLVSCDASGEASSVLAEGGKIVQVARGARKRGTTIEVRSLFYNVPARKKFQKSPAVSAAEVTKVVSALSLAHPEVGFELIQQQQELFSLPPLSTGELADRLGVRSGSVLGDFFAESAVKVFFEEAGVRLEGIIGSASCVRRNRTGQFLFVNRRCVFSPQLSFAIKDGYATRIDADRHPVFILHLTVPPSLVDVNVHPQKKQVRFQEEAALKDLVKRAIGVSLQHAEGVKIQSPFFGSEPWDLGAANFQIPNPFGHALPSTVVDFVSAAPVLREEREFEMQRDPQAIGLFGSYLLLDGESVAMKQGEGPGILLVDLLAALERITFDRALLGEVEKQGLLLPETFSVSVEEVQLLEAHRECIEKAGISVRAFGKQSVLVDAIPSFMEISDTAQALSYIVEVLQEGGDPTFDQLRQKRLAQVICRFVRAHKKHFVLQEALGIFRQLMETSAPHQCPQGKPTMHHLTTYEIKRFFKATE